MLLANITELEQTLASGKMESFRNQLINKLQNSVNWEELQKHMIYSEATDILLVAEAAEAMILHAKAIGGDEFAQKTAQAYIASIAKTEEGGKAILQSKTVQKSLQQQAIQQKEQEHQQAIQQKEQEHQQAIQQKEQAIQHFKRMGPLWAKDTEAAKKAQELIEAGQFEEVDQLLTKHGF
ncbi:MAG: hypothetical protein N2112_05530 [Gemmataceae bacterium]|jgi:hypothetical protein|nr:hypothetical protein [Gemmataceae bacterium]